MSLERGTRVAVDGVLFAGPFDLTRLVLTAPAVPVVEGVRRASVSTQVSQFSVAGNGTLAYVPGPLSSSSALLDLAVFDRKGTTTAVGMPPGAYEAPRMSPDGKHVAFHTDDGNSIVFVQPFPATGAVDQVSRDDERPSSGCPAEQSASQVHVVLNWFDELKARVPAR